jgi:DNA-binding response OmpR family regulator
MLAGVKILVVEDELRMAALLEQSLVEDGHVVTTANDGSQGLSLAQTDAFDLLILDVMLPGVDGWRILSQLRAKGSRVPVMMLTARDATSDVVQGLSMGADDYLVKPFSLEVLLARVRALGRRGPAPLSLVLQIGDLTLDQGTREVRRKDRKITLTKTEHSILEVLMRHAPRVVTYDMLLDSVWGGESDVEVNTVTAFMRLLRSKIEVADEARLLQTVRGVGYALRLEE